MGRVAGSSTELQCAKLVGGEAPIAVEVVPGVAERARAGETRLGCLRREDLPVVARVAGFHQRLGRTRQVVDDAQPRRYVVPGDEVVGRRLPDRVGEEAALWRRFFGQVARLVIEAQA